MRTKILTLMVALSFTWIVAMSTAYAGCLSKGNSSTVGESIEEGEVINDFCPMSGEKIAKDTSFRVKYNDEMIGFCSAACARAFEADPEKYHENISTQ